MLHLYIVVIVLTIVLTGHSSRIEARVTPLLPAQLARLTASPAVTFMTTLADHTSNGMYLNVLHLTLFILPLV